MIKALHYLELHRTHRGKCLENLTSLPQDITANFLKAILGPGIFSFHINNDPAIMRSKVWWCTVLFRTPQALKPPSLQGAKIQTRFKLISECQVITISKMTKSNHSSLPDIQQHYHCTLPQIQHIAFICLNALRKNRPEAVCMLIS